ncbi:chromodomain-helicase-DNA-binding protein 1-like [Marchantia polymorpha subsp. ruderalis]|uniref:Uncharacterized protein n=2 Tax=Marchantia polymorpha TaxID=3197 RepID=A0AAF6B2J7_MARPO|nr:hypothetical protein MARPO_0049s0091 [Marchantia polymorpha]BBN06231.1 hypothetical protein Mp_3g19430 [Marchantia polymorpha subsp. ruderalis]|eukprot:PTQ38812.1 hypothetical protein MARPO_0049s0091 [Marchantia polymorpha]
MGLGKTLQSITLLVYLKFQRHCPGPYLILCPLSVTDGWASELERFAPKLRVMRYVGDKLQRNSMRDTICNYVNKQSLETRADPALPFDILLTTYELAVLDAKFLSRLCWRYCIIDEAQRLKNSATVLYRTLLEKYMVPRRLLLTGTPIQNNLSELWALLHFCMPRVFGGRKEFLDAFGPAATATQTITEEDSPDNDDLKDSKLELKRLRQILRAFMLRRTKAALVKSKVLSLPPLTEVTVFTPLMPIQKRVYVSVLKKESPKIVGRNSGSASGPPLQNIVMQLRKACSHPYLFEGVEPEPFEEGEHLIEASGKLLMLDIMLKRLHAGGHRVLIFAQMTRTLDILQDYLQYRQYTYDRLDGSLRAEERFAAVRSFSTAKAASSSAGTQASAGPFVFLITTRAGGVGLNLVAADTVIFYEQDWNPQADKQALQRAHRMGQMSSVLVMNLITQHTVEEVILQRARTKLQLTHEVIGRDEADLEKHGPAGYDNSEMQAMIVFGLKKIVSDAKVASELHENTLDKAINKRELETIVDEALNQRAPLDDSEVKREFPTHNSHNALGDLSTNRLIKVEDGKVKKELPSLKSFSALEDLSANRDIKVEDTKPVDTHEALSILSSFVDIYPNTTSQGRDTSLGKRTRNHPTPEADLEAVVKRNRKAEENKRAKWASSGYKSLALPDTCEETGIFGNEEDEDDYIHYLVGDCTKPRLAPGESAIILWCMDDSGTWGKGGVFSALARLSKFILEAYTAAYSAGDLHMGDVHLVRVPDTDATDIMNSSIKAEDKRGVWTALCVVQSYDGRRKIPRSDISLSHFESCLKKVALAASKCSASIHMPRIHVGSGGKQGWYVVERLLRKYATAYHVHFNVYYFQRKASQYD